MSGSWLVSCFNKYVGVRDLYSPSCCLSNKRSAHLRIVCSKSSPASTPEVLISYTELNANNFQSNTLSNTVHASLHRALRSLKPIDLTSLNDFGVIGMGLAVYRGSGLLFCTLWHSFVIYLLVYRCTGTPTARSVSWVQESVEKETGKTLFNLGSCWLHILQDDFRDGCNAAKWNIEDSLSCLRCLFKDAPARREDFTKVKGYTTLPLDFWEMLQLLREHHHYHLIWRCMLMLSKLKQNYQSQQKKII